MSGIIGGAGSKSGILGTTELDYEEGTWSPKIQDSSGNQIGYGNQDGYYTKIGRSIIISGNVSANSLAGMNTANDCKFDGLPFAIPNVSAAYGTISPGYCAGLSGLTAGHNIVVNLQKGSSGGFLMKWSASTGQGFLTVGEFSASGHISFSGCYTNE